MVGSSTLYWFLLLALTILLAGFLGYLFFIDRHRREQAAKQSKEIQTLKQTVAALCSSAVGVDRRVNRLERQGRDLEERQENIEQTTQQGEPPYSDAIKMVRDGAGPEQLVEELGISRDAADLIIMIHGVKREEH
jgi:Tfp pilus assembly protein PilN